MSKIIKRGMNKATNKHEVLLIDEELHSFQSIDAQSYDSMLDKIKTGTPAKKINALFNIGAEWAEHLHSKVTAMLIASRDHDKV